MVMTHLKNCVGVCGGVVWCGGVVVVVVVVVQPP